MKLNRLGFHCLIVLRVGKIKNIFIMEKSTISLNKGTITHILAMSTAGKSFFKKRAGGTPGVKVFDTDDFYDHDVKHTNRLAKVSQSLDDRHFDAWHAKQHARGRNCVSNVALKTMISSLTDAIKIETYDF